MTRIERIEALRARYSRIKEVSAHRVKVERRSWTLTERAWLVSFQIALRQDGRDAQGFGTGYYIRGLGKFAPTHEVFQDETVKMFKTRLRVLD